MKDKKELDLSLFEIAQSNSSQYLTNIFTRNKKATDYIGTVRKKQTSKDVIFSIIVGVIIGIVIGFFKVMSVSAECNTFSKQEWIDICYISRMVEAESGNQTELGKRLVADTVLNRLNNGNFGSDVKSIIDAENQYCDGIQASADTIRIVMEEYENQTNTEVLYFRTDKYHEWAVDMFVVGDHYFSK